MDPYRPNQYGYNPRGGPRPFRPNFNRPPPPSHYPNMTLGGYPSQPHMPPQGAPPPGGSPISSDRSKLNTLFVGAIPTGVQDDWIDQLLKACGVLLEWKRVKDQAGNPKGFGFATYHSPDSVLRALRVLGGEENYAGIILKAQDGSGVEKKLIVKADDTVRQYLDQYKGSKEPAQLADEKEQDTKALETVTSIVQSIASGKQADVTTTPASSSSPATGNNKPINSLDTLSQDLAFLRERATRKQQQQQQSPPHTDSLQQTRRMEEGRRQDQRRQHQRQEFVRGQTEQLSIDEYDIRMAQDDEEAEQRRREKHQKEMENSFRQREKRFEQQEATQLIDYEDDLNREKADEKRREQDKAYWAERLAEWDDEIEMTNDKNEFYSDRSRWRKARASIRRREEERDEKDRQLELEKIQAASEEHNDERENSPPLDTNNDDTNNNDNNNVSASTPYVQQPTEVKPSVIVQMKPIAPTKIKSNISRQLPAKRASGLGGDDDDDEDGGRKRRVLIPLDYSGIENDGETEKQQDIDNSTVTGEPVSEEERNKRIKELIASIPSSEDDLWAWNIRWDVLNDTLIAEKLSPFVSKKIVELVGVEEEELASFILESIKKQTPPLDLVKELEMALDEDALVFVMKLWRTIIFETERIARHL
ncbi:hypothetical protein BCR42DRAFT_446075 [Absidia repens]|uniref:PWI domain-containing protein n=1 Tax=Absidia repens TaxID=90262 RepID=A0A1X2IXV1_9FUNG|nr:hypothetical protein BCR42DRAFT_446075 [Absidia repens]